MSDGRKQDGPGGAGKAYSVDYKSSERFSGACAFCLLVLNVYPDLVGMSRKDEVTFREHLKKVHGLTGHISR